MATNGKLRLVPVTGKYCQISFQGKKYEVWRTLPGAAKGAVGTAFDYNIAIQLLCLQPPVVAIVPKIEDGKFVQQIAEKDLATVKEAQQTGQTRLSNAFNNVTQPEAAKDETSSEIIEALKAQNQALQETIKAQEATNQAQMVAFQEQLKTLAAQVTALKPQVAETKPADGGKPAQK